MYKRQAEQVLHGIVEGCKQAGCALVGGETAEMPDFYKSGEYDLGGFAVGFLEPKQAMPRDKKIKPGDVILGLKSSGCHSNGYSLLRKLLPEEKIQTDPAVADRAFELLTPTRIYARTLGPLIRKRLFKGLAHITGSGFLNVPRMSDKVSYQIRLPDATELPPVYAWVRRESRLPLAELAQTFNLGVGMVAVVAKKDAVKVMKQLQKAGETVFELGQVVKREKGKPSQVKLVDGTNQVTLDY